MNIATLSIIIATPFIILMLICLILEQRKIIDRKTDEHEKPESN